MKYPLLILSFLALSIEIAQAQDDPQLPASIETGIASIAGDGIENLMLGCADCISSKRVKANKLFNTLPVDLAQQCGRHPSYTIKYYSFLRLLAADDSLAFNYMKENIGDTTWVGIRGACTFDECRFNELLAREYGQYIYHKSKSISFGIDGRSYRFKKTDSKSGGKSLQEFEKLVRAYGIKVI